LEEALKLSSDRILNGDDDDDGTSSTASLVSKSAQFTVLKTHKPHNIYTTFRNLLLYEQKGTHDTC